MCRASAERLSDRRELERSGCDGDVALDRGEGLPTRRHYRCTNQRTDPLRTGDQKSALEEGSSRRCRQLVAGQTGAHEARQRRHDTIDVRGLETRHAEEPDRPRLVLVESSAAPVIQPSQRGEVRRRNGQMLAQVLRQWRRTR